MANNYQGGYGGEYNTSYGPQGGAGGGGFMEGGGSQMNGSQNNADKYGKDTLRACTILQIQTAEKTPSDEFQVDGMELGHAKIIGQIRNVAKLAIGMSYTLDDGTGTIEGRDYIKSGRPTHDEEGNPLPPPPSEKALEVGQWAKCFGKPKQVGNNPKRNFNILGIKPINDKNEINHHLLECTAMHLLYTKGPPGGGGDGAKQEEGGLFVPNHDPSRKMNGLSANAQKVYSFLQKQEASNEGFHAQTISSATRLSFNDVLQAGEELTSASLIFDTVDDQTWALLDQ